MSARAEKTSDGTILEKDKLKPGALQSNFGPWLEVLQKDAAEQEMKLSFCLSVVSTNVKYTAAILTDAQIVAGEVPEGGQISANL